MLETIKERFKGIEGDIAIWASAHNMNDIQRKELEDNFDTVVELKELWPDLHRKMCNMDESTDMSEIMQDLEDLNFCAQEMMLLIQPAGSPGFIYFLGSWIFMPVIFAHSKRVSEDVVQADGSVVKTSKFVHAGWWGDGYYFKDMKAYVQEEIRISIINNKLK